MDYRKFYKERYKIEFGSDYDIHHIDLNHENNSIDNLILIPKELHKELHQAIKDIPFNGEGVFLFGGCDNQTYCSIISRCLKQAAGIYEKLQYLAQCKQMEELALSTGKRDYFTYNRFRK